METNQEFRPTRSRYLVITADYIVPAAVVIACLLLWWLVFYTPLFTVRHIDCELDFAPCGDSSIKAELEKQLGQNLIRLDEAAIRERITSADFTIREVELRKQLPNSLSVSLQSVYPVVAAQVQGNATWVTFDDKLRVIGTRQVDPNVPTVILNELNGILVGQKIESTEVNKALSLSRDLTAELTGVKTIELSGSTLTLSLQSGVKSIMTTTKDLGEQIRALQAVLANATMLAGVNVIDVRFNQPVLK